MRATRLSALIFVSTLTAAAAQAAISDTVHRTFNVAEGGTLNVEVDGGGVKIVSGGSGVTVDVDRKARTSSKTEADEIFGKLELTIDQQGNDVRVISKYPRTAHWFNWSNELDLHYTIHVPTRYNINVSTSGGDLDVSDLTGQVDAKTSGGEVKLGRITGQVTAHTSGGDVSLRGGTGAVRLSTSGGSIDLDEAGGSVEAKTSGGSIDIGHVAGSVLAHTSGGSIQIGSAGGAIDASTSGGSITATLAQQPQAESRLKTSGGGVTVTIGPSVAVDLDARASGGGVTSDMPVTVQGTMEEDAIVGKINGGGPKFVVRTSGGGIRLKKM